MSDFGLKNIFNIFEDKKTDIEQTLKNKQEITQQIQKEKNVLFGITY